MLECPAALAGLLEARHAWCDDKAPRWWLCSNHAHGSVRAGQLGARAAGVR